MKQRRLAMPASVKGAVELRKALKQFSPDLAKETQKELAAILKPITASARGFIPSTAPLSGWAKGGGGAWGTDRVWSSGAAKRGIGYKTTPSKANRSGWRSLARIVNASVSGSIYETAGRLNPHGRPQAPIVQVVAPRHENYGKFIRSGSKGQSLSNNPNAGRQFIESMDRTGKIVDAYQRGAGEAGRASRKMKGRAIFRAWKEDQGKATAAVIKAIEKSRDKLEARVK
jgi:hypothetical protein